MINEAIEQESFNIVSGIYHDYVQYREKVSFVKALKTVIQLCEETQELMDK